MKEKIILHSTHRICVFQKKNNTSIVYKQFLNKNEFNFEKECHQGLAQLFGGEQHNPTLEMIQFCNYTLTICFLGFSAQSQEVEIQGKVRKRRFNHWEISTGYEESNNMKTQLIKIVDLLQEKIDILNQLRDQYDLEFFLDNLYPPQSRFHPIFLIE